MSEVEVDEIIALAKQPGWLHKDIAWKFRVSPILVSRICTEAQKKPEKMLARRQQRQLLEDKKDAIFDVTEDIL